MYKYNIYIKLEDGKTEEFTKFYKWKNIDTVANHHIRKIEKQRIYFNEVRVTKL